MQAPNSGDSPRIAKTDSLKIKKVQHPFSFKQNPKNPINELIVEAVNRMGASGDHAEENFQKALIALREKAERAIAIITDEYASLPEDRYLDRWSLIQLLAELKHPACLGSIEKLLSTAIPAEHSKRPHSFSTRGQEIIIRTTGVETLARMAADGQKAGLGLLLKYCTHENVSVKRACIQAYLEHGGPKARQELLKVVPEKDRYILEIKRVDVRTVSQPDGRLHLAYKEAEGVPPLRAERKKQG